MTKSSGGKRGGGRQGPKDGGPSRPDAGWPSKTNNPSGPRRTDNPPSGGRKR